MEDEDCNIATSINHIQVKVINLCCQRNTMFLGAVREIGCNVTVVGVFVG